MLGLLFATALITETELTLPAGAHPDFTASIRRTLQAMEAGDYTLAERLRKWLPRDVITVQYDDSKVPPRQKSRYREGFAKALSEWASVPNGPRFSEEPNAQIRVTYEPVLGESETPGTPRGAAIFFYDKASPRLEVVIGLKRGAKQLETDSIEVRNEVLTAVSTFLGLAPNPLFGFAASRTDLNTNRPIGIFPGDMVLYAENRQVLKSLDTALVKKEKVRVGQPTATFRAATLDAGVVDEGVRAEFSVQLTNTGSGILVFKAATDCGCVIPPPPLRLQPGQTVLVQPKIDTTGYTGEISQRVIFYTNDPDQPAQIVPLKVRSRPKYRWLAPKGSTFAIHDTESEIEFLLFPPTGVELTADRLVLQEISGQINVQPWTGEIADPELNEPIMPRKGYRVTIRVQPDDIVGRVGAAIGIRTSSPGVANPGGPQHRKAFFVQRGILVSPPDVYFGDLEIGKKSSFELAKPTQFRVKSVSVSNPAFKVEEVMNDGKRFVYRVTYLGGLRGDIQEAVILTTDDPKQPTLRVAIIGSTP